MKSMRIHQLLFGFTLLTFSGQMTGQDRLKEYFSEPNNGNTYVIAHRGVHNGIPENSLAAYQKAIDLRCDFIEIDVRKSKDGRMVSIHNSTIDAYVSGATGKVSDFTLAELKALDIGERLGLQWKNTRIPTIEEILQLCRGQIGIYLDLKEPHVPELVSIIKKYGMERDIVWYIPSSYMAAIKDLKSLCPDCLPMPDPGPAGNIVEVIKQVQPLVIATDMGELSEEYMKIAREHHTMVFVDEDKGDEAEWTKILNWGAEGIQTDKPQELIRFLKNSKATSNDMPDRGICAHRGAMDNNPENTLAAFNEAVRLGAHMIELDVRMTKDGHLVILHDDTVDRTTNGKGQISELTIDEVNRLDAGSWKSEKFAGETIPTFKDALAVMPENIWINVHIKGGMSLGQKVARIIVDENRVHQAFLACGSEAARGAQEISQELMICNMDRLDDRDAYMQETIRQKSQFIQLHSSRTDQHLDSEIATLKQHHIRINYCCTDDKGEVEALLNSGVDFILTDQLSEMLELAASLGIEQVK
jgi:glycerophosphoryl diester phosphodiesterase